MITNGTTPPVTHNRLEAYTVLTSGGPLTNGQPQPDVNDPRFYRMMDLVHNSLVMRRELIGLLMDRRRNYDQECGYPTPQSSTGTMTEELWQQYHDFDPFVGTLNELMAKECFQTTPEFYEDPDPEVTTELEQSWNDLPRSMGGEPSHAAGGPESHPVWSVVKDAWVKANINRYGVIFIGFNDAEPGEDPATHLRRQVEARPYKPMPERRFNEDGTKVADDGRRVLFFRVFPERLAKVARWVQSGDRMGEPEAYHVTFADPQTQLTDAETNSEVLKSVEVHASRCIHICPNPGSHPWVGHAYCENVIKPVVNLQKILGADGEGRWKMAFSTLIFETAPGYKIGTAEADAAKNQLEQWENGLQRAFAAVGFTAKTLAPAVTDPNPGVEINLRAISIRKRIPRRILEGSELGKANSEQDERAWNERKQEFFRNEIYEKAIKPLLDRLVNVGALARPRPGKAGKPGGYKVDLPAMDTQGQEDKVRVAGMVVDLMVKFIGGGCDALCPPKFLFTNVLKGYFTQDEVEQMLEEAEARYGGEGGDDDLPLRNPMLATAAGGTLYSTLFKEAKAGSFTEEQLRSALRMVFGMKEADIDEAIADGIEPPPDPLEQAEGMAKIQAKFAPKPAPGRPGQKQIGAGPKQPKSPVGNDATANTKKGEKGGNCGIGPGGFQPGNKCAVGGSGGSSGSGDPAKAVRYATNALDRSKQTKGEGLKHAKVAALAAAKGDYAGAAAAHAKAARAHASDRNKLADGDRAKNGFFKHNDAATWHKYAADEYKKMSGGQTGKVSKTGIHHVGENERAISHTAHEGNKPVGRPGLHKLAASLKLKSYDHKFGGASIGERGNGHTKANSVAIDQPSGKVREKLEKAGWKKTEVHNLPSASGGKNHQETLTKDGQVLTLVDYGYGTTTIRMSKKSPVGNVFCPTGKGGGVKPTCGKGGTIKGTPPVKERVKSKADTHGTEAERQESRAMADRKIAAAPVPTKAEVKKARADAKREGGRAGGDSRGGSSADRKKQRENLWKEWGGDVRGYIVCPWSGQKMHLYDEKDPRNPNGYPKFERGKIFTKCQGGGYRLPNLLPESFEANRSRNDKRVRTENSRGC